MTGDDLELRLLDERIWEVEISGLRRRVADLERENEQLRGENELLRCAPTPY